MKDGIEARGSSEKKIREAEEQTTSANKSDDGARSEASHVKITNEQEPTTADPKTCTEVKSSSPSSSDHDFRDLESALADINDELESGMPHIQQQQPR
jgi:hypothetical protein